jgi:hypothetical protein
MPEKFVSSSHQGAPSPNRAQYVQQMNPANSYYDESNTSNHGDAYPMSNPRLNSMKTPGSNQSPNSGGN